MRASAVGFTTEFEVDDVSEAEARIRDLGETAEQEPRTEPWGHKSFRMLSSRRSRGSDLSS